MRSNGILGGLSLASAGLLSMPAMASIGHGQVIVIGPADRLGPQVVVDDALVADTIEVRRALPRDGERRRRAKGPQAKPRKRSNRQHVSKRTRRKHRRAA